MSAVGHETEHWSVYRRYLEFYVLESKLTEFHGEFLPSKVTFSCSKIQPREQQMEHYLHVNLVFKCYIIFMALVLFEGTHGMTGHALGIIFLSIFFSFLPRKISSPSTGSFPDAQLPSKRIIGPKNYEFLTSKREEFQEYLQVEMRGAISSSRFVGLSFVKETLMTFGLPAACSGSKSHCSITESKKTIRQFKV